MIKLRHVQLFNFELFQMAYIEPYCSYLLTFQYNTPKTKFKDIHKLSL